MNKRIISLLIISLATIIPIKSQAITGHLPGCPNTGYNTNCCTKEFKINVKEGYKLGDDLSSKVLAFAFSISAEIERSLLSQRTTEALKRKKAEGIKLGRPLGRKATKYKLSGKEELIIEMLDAGFSKTYITKYLGVSSATLYSFMKRTKIYIP